MIYTTVSVKNIDGTFSVILMLTSFVQPFRSSLTFGKGVHKWCKGVHDPKMATPDTAVMFSLCDCDVQQVR